MPQVSKPPSSSLPAGSLFGSAGTGAQEVFKTASDSLPSPRAGAKSDPKARPLSFEQTISAAVTRSTPRKPEAGAPEKQPVLAPALAQGKEKEAGPGATNSTRKFSSNRPHPAPETIDSTETALASESAAQKPAPGATAGTVSEETEEETGGLACATAASTATAPDGMPSELTTLLAATISIAATPVLAAAPPPAQPPLESEGTLIGVSQAQTAAAASASAQDAGDVPGAQTEAKSTEGRPETRQISIPPQSDRPNLPSQTEPLTTPAVDQAAPSIPTGADVAEPVATEAKSAPSPHRQELGTDRQSDPRTLLHPALGSTTEGMPEAVDMEPASPSEATPQVEEVLARFQIASRGTPTASEKTVMKTSDSFAPALTAPSLGASQEETAGITPTGDGGVSSSQRQSSPGDPESREAAASHGDRNEQGASSLDRAHGSISFTSQVSTPGIEEVARPTDLHSIEMLRNEILNRVVDIRNENPTSMTVILRPDQGTELTVHLKNTEGRIEVQVRLEKGDGQAYRSSWETLQQSLSQRGVSLAGLETAARPTLVQTPIPSEARNDLNAVTTGHRAMEATLASSGSASLSSGSDQREREWRDSASTATDAGWDSPKDQRGRAPSFSLEDQDLSQNSRSASAPSVWINPLRRGPLLTSDLATASTSATADLERTTAAPWESWA